MNEIERINDIRTLLFIINKLNPTWDINRHLLRSNDKKIIQNEITKILNLQEKNNTKIINSLVDSARENMLPMKEFDWIINDKNIAHYIFGYIFIRENGGVLSDVTTTSALNKQINELKKTERILTTVNHEERILEIINYFDLTSTDEVNLKYLFMDELKKSWFHSCLDVKMFKWLTLDNLDSIDWAFDYLKKYNELERKGLLDRNKDVLLINFFNPINLEEKKLAIYTILKLWKCHHSEKRLLISNMNKAWQQRKLRRDRENKKAINCYVDKKVKDKLDFLVEYKRCQMNQVITDLINDAYSSLKSDIE